LLQSAEQLLLENPAYHVAKSVKAGIEADVKKAEDALDTFPRGPTGLTPDHVKVSPEYRAAKSSFNTHFKRLQTFNQTFVKTFRRNLLLIVASAEVYDGFSYPCVLGWERLVERIREQCTNTSTMVRAFGFV
jgi:hypothetical protein